MIPANDLFDAFNKASIADPQAHILAVAFTLTWLRIQREIAAEGIPWEDAVCLCFPTAIDVTGLVVGFNWTDDPRIAAVRARWDSTEAVGDGLGAAMAALGVELERTTDEEVGEGLYGLALAAEMWREAAELAKAADSPAKARTAL